MIKKHRGFTLIELMVTIAIFTIIAMMAAPSFNDFVSRQRLMMTARELVLIFGEARSQAAALRTTTVVTFANGVNTQRTFFWTPNHSDVTLVGDTMNVIFNENGFTEVRTKSVPAVNDDGEIIPDQFENVEVPTVFTLCSGRLNESKIVTISKTGVVEAIRNGEACT